MYYPSLLPKRKSVDSRAPSRQRLLSLALVIVFAQILNQNPCNSARCVKLPVELTQFCGLDCGLAAVDSANLEGRLLFLPSSFALTLARGAALGITLGLICLLWQSRAIALEEYA